MSDVKIETSRNYLNQVRDIDKMIDYKCERLEELKAQVSCIKSSTQIGDRVQSTLTNDAIPKLVTKMISLQEEINRDIDKFFEKKSEISQTLDKIDDPDAIKVLYKRYFEYKSFQSIASEMCFSKRTIQRIHYRGLEKLSPFVT